MIRKTLLLVACLALAASPCFGQEWAAKMFKTTEHDFGTVARGSKAEFDFTFSNLYLEDVHIVTAYSSCGCTSVDVVKPTLKTYEEGAIRAVFNTPTFLGSRSATITVVIDKPMPAEVLLHVRGVIRGDVVFEPGSVQLGDVAAGNAGRTQGPGESLGLGRLANYRRQIVQPPYFGQGGQHQSAKWLDHAPICR